MNDMKIKILDKIYPVNSFVFSGGEMHVKIPSLSKENKEVLYKFDEFGHEILADCVTILTRMQSPDSLVKLLMVANVMENILRSTYKGRITVNTEIPYLPYARQDRIIESNEPFSQKVFLEVLTSHVFSIKTYDIHSQKYQTNQIYSPRIDNVSQIDIIKKYESLVSWIREHRPIIVAPDHGAYEKSLAIAKEFELPFMAANKTRQNGEVVGMNLPNANFVKDKHVLIADDICDGGRTFIELGNILRAEDVKSTTLYVTHGIFNKGYGVFDRVIDRIFTTNTFLPKEPPSIKNIPVYVYHIIKDI